MPETFWPAYQHTDQCHTDYPRLLRSQRGLLRQVWIQARRSGDGTLLQQVMRNIILHFQGDGVSKEGYIHEHFQVGWRGALVSACFSIKYNACPTTSRLRQDLPRGLPLSSGRTTTWMVDDVFAHCVDAFYD